MSAPRMRTAAQWRKSRPTASEMARNDAVALVKIKITGSCPVHYQNAMFRLLEAGKIVRTPGTNFAHRKFTVVA